MNLQPLVKLYTLCEFTAKGELPEEEQMDSLIMNSCGTKGAQGRGRVSTKIGGGNEKSG